MKLHTTQQALLDSLRIEFEKEQGLKRMKLQTKPGMIQWLGCDVPMTLDFTRKDGEYVDMYVQSEWVTYAGMVKTVTRAVQSIAAQVPLTVVQ